MTFITRIPSNKSHDFVLQLEKIAAKSNKNASIKNFISFNHLLCFIRNNSLNSPSAFLFYILFALYTIRHLD